MSKHLPLTEHHVAIRTSMEAGIAYITGTQHTAGSWTDFWLPVGTSDAWVTAYIGLALHAASQCLLLDGKTRSIAAQSALSAAHWLLRQRRPLRGWGYNGLVPPDADSTAHALSLLARVGLNVPDEAVAFLHEHEVPGKGFKTFRWNNPRHQWAQPCTDVTVAALRALYDIGEITQEELRENWSELLAAAHDANGWWQGYWWTTPNYTTGLVLEVWRNAGCPPRPHPSLRDLPTDGAFDLAWALHAYVNDGKQIDTSAFASYLIALQEDDGAWKSTPILRVRPSYDQDQGIQHTQLSRDARCLFTTATVVYALASAYQKATLSTEVQAGPVLLRKGPGTIRPLQRSRQGQVLDELVFQAARSIGLPLQSSREIQALFTVLTQKSLSTPSPWPALQLSSLAGGIPLEFSATVGPHVKPGLRYTVEVSTPFVSPHDRARSGIAAIAHAATYLGYEAVWERIAPAIECLVSPDLPVPDGLRFWVWGGVDHVALKEEDKPSPLLKIYLNLLHYEAGGASNRLLRALQAAGIPRSSELYYLLDVLNEVGFLHEAGFGMGPHGKLACKVYYELPGWQCTLVQQLLERLRFPCNKDAVCPEIPGILRESLAAKKRAGIAFRIDPTYGTIRELTIAAAFPPPVITHTETHRRVEAWISEHKWNAETYHNLSRLLLSAWQAHPDAPGYLHSLFTRTVSPETAWTSIYMRPYLG